MAAVLCKWLCFPCEFVANCCESCCKGCTRDCEEGCNSCCGFIDRPLSCCGLFAICMNIAPLIAGIVILCLDWTTSCYKPLSPWLIVAVVANFIHLIFGVYVIRALSYRAIEEGHGKSEFSAATSFLLYDVNVALYIIFSLFTLIWGIVGIVWTAEESASGTCKSTHESLWQMCLAMAIINVLYFFIGFGVVLMSLCAATTCCIEIRRVCCCWNPYNPRQARLSNDQAKQQQNVSSGPPNQTIPSSTTTTKPNNYNTPYNNVPPTGGNQANSTYAQPQQQPLQSSQNANYGSSAV